MHVTIGVIYALYTVVYMARHTYKIGFKYILDKPFIRAFIVCVSDTLNCYNL